MKTLTTTCIAVLALALAACGSQDIEMLQSAGAAASSSGAPAGARTPGADPTSTDPANSTSTEPGPNGSNPDEQQFAWVSLTWEGHSDVNLDLHVVNPAGGHIYYLSTTASEGTGEFAPNDECISFDCDGTEDNPRETIYWPLEDLQEGHYDVWVSDASDQGISFKLEIHAGDSPQAFEESVGANSETSHFGFDVGGSQEPDPTGPCLEQLDQLGVQYQAITIAENDVCTVKDAVMTTGPINGIDYRVDWARSTTSLRQSCDLALALYRLGDLLKEYDITQVNHLGAYNCRNVAGTDTPSQHSYGLALDIAGFVDSSGTEYSVLKDWEHGTDDPQTHKGQVLYDIAHRMHDEHLFNVVLTPEYNSDHDNHFHVDLTEGSNFIGESAQFPEYYIGSDRADACPATE